MYVNSRILRLLSLEPGSFGGLEINLILNRLPRRIKRLRIGWFWHNRLWQERAQGLLLRLVLRRLPSREDRSLAAIVVGIDSLFLCLSFAVEAELLIVLCIKQL